MAKVYLDADIQAISGRLSKTTNASYARNKKTGKCYRYEYNVDTKYSNTTKQQAVRDTFTAKIKALATWWNANKQVTGTDGTVTQAQTAHMTELLEMYNAQSKYGNPYLFARSIVTDDAKIVLKSGSYVLTTDGQTATKNDDETDEM